LQNKNANMRFVLFFIALFVTIGCLEGGFQSKHPLDNFGAIIILWAACYAITEPRRRKVQYWRNRRRLEINYMRAYLRNNNYWH
jgi:hypothetical protein